MALHAVCFDEFFSQISVFDFVGLVHGVKQPDFLLISLHQCLRVKINRNDVENRHELYGFHFFAFG